MSKKKSRKYVVVSKQAGNESNSASPSPMRVFAAEAKIAENQIKAASMGKTTDNFENFVSRLGINNNNALSAGSYYFNYVTKNQIKLEAAYRGSWVVGQVVDSVAEDMTRAGINITTNESEEDIKDLYNAIVRLQVWSSILHLIKWGRLYGGALGVLQIEGQDLKTPLNLETIAQNQFKGVVVYDRWQLNPVLTPVIQSGPNMGLPQFYQIVTSSTAIDPNAAQGGLVLVHHSRVIRYTGIDLPYFQAITENMWGESVLERMWDRLISFDNATMSSASLIDRANLRTVGVDGLREIIAAGGEAQAGLLAQFDMMRELQVNEGLTLLDKNDTFASTAYSFSGLSDMLLQFGQQIAGASSIPLVRLFGQSPAGLSATGESDIRMYYDNINAQQEARLRNGWQLLLQVLWRSTFGKPAPKDLEFKFTPLWQMSATDKANNSKTTTETIIGAYTAGLTDRATSLQELRASSSDTGIFSNITDEDIEEAKADEPPMPDMPEESPPEAPKPEEQSSKEVEAQSVPSASEPIIKPDESAEPVKNLDLQIPAWKKIAQWLSRN